MVLNQSTEDPALHVYINAWLIFFTWKCTGGWIWSFYGMVKGQPKITICTNLKGFESLASYASFTVLSIQFWRQIFEGFLPHKGMTATFIDGLSNQKEKKKKKSVPWIYGYFMWKFGWNQVRGSVIWKWRKWDKFERPGSGAPIHQCIMHIWDSDLHNKLTNTFNTKIPSLWSLGPWQ